jgi:hypothetical protein
MPRKLLVSRLGAGTITVALCAALPGCNLAIHPNNCFGQPSSRGMSSVECAGDARADTPGDATSDTSTDAADAPTGDAPGDRP